MNATREDAPRYTAMDLDTSRRRARVDEQTIAAVTGRAIAHPSNLAAALAAEGIEVAPEAARATDLTEFFAAVLPKPEAVHGAAGQALQRITGLHPVMLDWLAEPYFPPPTLDWLEEIG